VCKGGEEGVVCKLPQAHTGVTVGNASQYAAACTWCVRERDAHLAEGCSDYRR